MNTTTAAIAVILLVLCIGYGTYCAGYLVGYMAGSEEAHTGKDSGTEPVLLTLARKARQ